MMKLSMCLAGVRQVYQSPSVILIQRIHVRWLSFNKRHTYYDVLGIERTATATEIKSAFKDLSKKLHPDLNRNDPSFHAKFIKLNEAYGVLGKPVSRRNYDLSLSPLHQPHNVRQPAYRHMYTRDFEGHSYSGDFQRQQYWDDSIYGMRDRSKDKDYEGQLDVKRLPKLYVALGLIAFMIIGAVLRFIMIFKSNNWRQNVLKERDRKLSEQYLETRLRAE